jgi:hypothetical protein
MRVEAFLSCFSGEVVQLVTEGVAVRVHTWPLVDSADLVLAADIGNVLWSWRIDPDLIARRSEQWGRSCARGLALLAQDAWERSASESGD